MDDYSDEDDDDGSAPPDPEPYVFDPSHVADAAAMLDSACTDLQHGYTSERRVIALADARGLGDSPLMWELVHAVGHDLQREIGGRPGCSLGRNIDEHLLRWPRPVASAPADALQLWEAAAMSVTAPAAIARMEDLLFERRVGNGLHRARRAASNYLLAIDVAAELGMDRSARSSERGRLLVPSEKALSTQMYGIEWPGSARRPWRIHPALVRGSFFHCSKPSLKDR